jgi:hypothetical protein
MRRTVMSGVVLVGALASCTKPNPSYCDDTGDRPCGDGFVCVDHACVERIDAPLVDARGPIVETHQAADVVLGQADFNDRVTPICNATFLHPIGVAEAGDRIYGSDENSRVLIWNPVPVENNAVAALVLGQPTFTDCDSPLEQNSRTFGEPSGMFAIGTRVFVVELHLYRVLIWDSVGTSYAPADLVLGQPDMTSNAPSGGAADELADPLDAWSDGNKVIVADTGNDRILIWNSFPTKNRQPADVVVGHDEFGNFASQPPSAATLYRPSGVWSSQGRLFVADTGNHRVLIWNEIPTQHGQPADIVIGTDSFDEAPPSNLSADSFAAPLDLVADGDALFVSDPGNDRVLVFSPIPSANGSAATQVLGQADLTSGANDRPPSERSLNRPERLSLGPSGLWVADEDNYRLLHYKLYPDE